MLHVVEKYQCGGIHSIQSLKGLVHAVWMNDYGNLENVKPKCHEIASILDWMGFMPMIRYYFLYNRYEVTGLEDLADRPLVERREK